MKKKKNKTSGTQSPVNETIEPDSQRFTGGHEHFSSETKITDALRIESTSQFFFAEKSQKNRH